ncbi:hypothetical protein [Prochlorococcus sp. MIT 1303]|uniref:hypothetical protein n=1 Tax=Prochlorococcus sp. MIT 1303 TaxID=1723647 RepID=UPI0007B3A0E2
MQRSIRLSLTLTGAAALALANSPIQPVAAQEEDGSADDLGVMAESKLGGFAFFGKGFHESRHSERGKRWALGSGI